MMIFFFQERHQPGHLPRVRERAECAREEQERKACRIFQLIPENWGRTSAEQHPERRGRVLRERAPLPARLSREPEGLHREGRPHDVDAQIAGGHIHQDFFRPR